jgi:hypothetical protein
MTEFIPQEPAPPNNLFEPTILPQTFLERYRIPPFLFAFGVLLVVFVLYQLVGGVIAFFMFGFSPSSAQVTGLRVSTAAAQLVFILLPTLLLVRMATFRPSESLRMRLPDSAATFVLAIIGIFSLQQVLQIYLTWQDKIPLPKSIERIIEPLRQAIEEMTKMLVSSTTPKELAFVLIVVAVVPAICEEFLFRGLVQRSFENSFGRKYSVLLTGCIFGAYHLNPFEFVPLALLGMYLGFLAMRANSLWVSVTGHFFNNAVAVVAVYMHIADDAIVTGKPEELPFATLAYTFVVCGLIFAASTYLFLKVTEPKQIAITS